MQTKDTKTVHIATSDIQAAREMDVGGGGGAEGDKSTFICYDTLNELALGLLSWPT